MPVAMITDHGPHPAAIPVGDKAAFVARQAPDFAGGDAAAELAELGLQGLQQRRALHAVGKTRIVMADRDQRQPALALVDDHDVAMEAPQVDRRRQPARPGADDQAIVHRYLVGNVFRANGHRCLDSRLVTTHRSSFFPCNAAAPDRILGRRQVSEFRPLHCKAGSRKERPALQYISLPRRRKGL
jgi:hypothetical protein